MARVVGERSQCPGPSRTEHIQKKVPRFTLVSLAAFALGFGVTAADASRHTDHRESDRVAGQPAGPTARRLPPPAPPELQQAVRFREATIPRQPEPEGIESTAARAKSPSLTGCGSASGAAPGASTTSGGSSVGDVDGPVTLSVQKSWNGSTWDLLLAWSGNAGVVTVSTSTNPSFQDAVVTLEKEYGLPSATIAEDSTRMLECFDVTDSTTASRAFQGMGFDPDPPPGPPTLAGGLSSRNLLADKWWGDVLSINSRYLAPVPTANFIGLQNRMVRANAVSGVAGGFASGADFFVPEDSRSG
jgi:hypothetical protein